jgi:hypothetical protein
MTLTPLDAQSGRAYARQMEKGRALGPLAFLALGAVVLFFGIGYVYDDTEPLGIICTVAGAASLLFGLIAQAVKIGVRAAKGEDGS